MKKILLILLVLGYSTLILADEQIYCDTIFLKDNQIIVAKTKDILPNQITYVMCDYQNGPTFTIPMQEIIQIKFANGKLLIVQKESDNISMSSIEAADNQQEDIEQNFISFAQSTKQNNNHNEVFDDVEEIKNVFQANFDFAGIFGNVDLSSLDLEKYRYGGLAIDAIFGVRLRRFAFVGVGISFQTTFINITLPKNTTGIHFLPASLDKVSVKPKLHVINMLLPLYANAKLYYPTMTNINPYLDVNIGGYIGLPSAAATNNGNGVITKLSNGFYFRVGAGLEIKHFDIGVGYQLYKPGDSAPSHMGYVKLGIRVGK